MTWPSDRQFIYIYHNDHLGTPQKMTDASGTVVWAADYKPFGEATITVSTITNNLRFPGQYYDAETGLNYNYFRDYNAIIGRYIESDPVGLWSDINLFNYVNNAPTTSIDPSGLFRAVVADPGGRYGPTYGGSMFLIGNSGESVYVPISIYPNPYGKAPGIAGGIFPSIYSPVGHQKTKPGIRLRDGGKIRTLRANPAQNNNKYATGVNIHCGDSPTNRGSKNCIVIHPDYCQDVWDVLEPNETGIVDVNRSVFSQFNIWLLNLFVSK
jgi:RHS repeat-associated protein